jgi:glycogen(starch) synthase
MRILVLSNFYPPNYIGGYELGCRDVVERLKARGHEVRVLTSTYQVGSPQRDGDVYRWLRCDMRLFLSDEGSQLKRGRKSWAVNMLLHSTRLLKMEQQNQRAMQDVCAEFKPDLVYCWNLRGISISAAYMARDMGLPVSFFISDNWLSFWEMDPWYQVHVTRDRHKVTKLLMKPFQIAASLMKIRPLHGPPDLRNVQFCSQFLKDQALRYGRPVEDATVVRWCVDTAAWPFREEQRRPRKLLYVGQTIPSKGIQTAIKAVAYLRRLGHRDVTLTIAGGSALADHDVRVRQLIEKLKLEKEVHFVGRLPRHELRELYQSHDILVFPTIGDEPFAITPLEAMASGMAVVGTLTGGSPELFRNNVTALTFDKGDALACARRISKLLNAPHVAERLRRTGHRVIHERHTFDVMLGQIEGCLNQALAREGRAPIPAAGSSATPAVALDTPAVTPPAATPAAKQPTAPLG